MNEAEDGLAARMRHLRIHEEDLQEDFVRGTGPGGQKINKTSSTVVLRHLPTGIEVRCQRERSQAQNRQVARTELCDRIEAAHAQERLTAQNEREKARRQNRPKPRSLKRKFVESKRRRAGIKSGRGKQRGDD
ncbi:MAG: peptide chain release factor-like protein [Verrucomicrobiaceae bacterium]|nr:peptide chain release factor-like protein [Verrucomicrobiaceae bacterium]